MPVRAVLFDAGGGVARPIASPLEIAMRPWPRLLYLLNRLCWRLTRPVTIGVRLILVQGTTVLPVRHTYQQHWYLPGGGVERGETLEEAARREAAEELGARLGRLRLFGVYSNFYEHKSDHVVVFPCDELQLVGETGPEIESLSFFALGDLPPQLSPGSRRRIQESLAGNPPIASRW